MADTLHYGVVGLTGRGSSHLREAEAADGVSVVAGSDVVDEYVETFEAETGARGYSDHAEMLDAEALDAVSVCTPSGTHADIAIDCLEAGVSVLVEKPFDVYLDRVDAMVEAAEAADAKLACGFQRRFRSDRWTAKRWIDEGRFGDLILADTAVKWHRPQRYYEDGWHGTRDLDGGVLLQQAVHHVDLLQWLAGDVASVHARLGTLAHDMECEDTAVVTLEFEDGGFGCIEATTAVNGGRDHLELNGTDGSYNSGAFVVDGDEVEPDLDDPPYGTGLAGVMGDFVAAIREDRAPIVDGPEGRKAIELVMAAYASSSLDRSVALDEVRDLREHT